LLQNRHGIVVYTTAHPGCVSLDTLHVPLPKRTVTVSLPPHLDHLMIGGGL